ILRGDPEPAFEVSTQTALNYRLDLMNQRARVVDAWRKVAVTANALLGVFNVEYNLSAFSPRGLAQPLALDGSRVQHQLILNGQLPLVRKAERNLYRAALINYQHERRDLLALEDSIVQTIRAEIRQLRVLAANYKIQQKVVELSYSNLENSKESFQAPAGGAPAGAAPGAPGPPSQGAAANAAALTNQLLQAQGTLNGAQNTLFGLWINYLNTRIQLSRDLELMPLDFRGVWIDELAPNESHRGGDVAAAVPTAVDAGDNERQRAGLGNPILGEPIVPARLLAPTATPAQPHD